VARKELLVCESLNDVLFLTLIFSDSGDSDSDTDDWEESNSEQQVN